MSKSKQKALQKILQTQPVIDTAALGFQEVKSLEKFWSKFIDIIENNKLTDNLFLDLFIMNKMVAQLNVSMALNAQKYLDLIKNESFPGKSIFFKNMAENIRSADGFLLKSIDYLEMLYHADYPDPDFKIRQTILEIAGRMLPTIVNYVFIHTADLNYNKLSHFDRDNIAEKVKRIEDIADVGINIGKFLQESFEYQPPLINSLRLMHPENVMLVDENLKRLRFNKIEVQSYFVVNNFEQDNEMRKVYLDTLKRLPDNGQEDRQGFYEDTLKLWSGVINRKSNSVVDFAAKIRYLFAVTTYAEECGVLKAGKHFKTMTEIFKQVLSVQNDIPLKKCDIDEKVAKDWITVELNSTFDMLKLISLTQLLVYTDRNNIVAFAYREFVLNFQTPSNLNSEEARRYREIYQAIGNFNEALFDVAAECKKLSEKFLLDQSSSSQLDLFLANSQLIKNDTHKVIAFHESNRLFWLDVEAYEASVKAHDAYQAAKEVLAIEDKKPAQKPKAKKHNNKNHKQTHTSPVGKEVKKTEAKKPNNPSPKKPAVVEKEKIEVKKKIVRSPEAKWLPAYNFLVEAANHRKDLYSDQVQAKLAEIKKFGDAIDKEQAVTAMMDYYDAVFKLHFAKSIYGNIDHRDKGQVADSIKKLHEYITNIIEDSRGFIKLTGKVIEVYGHDSDQYAFIIDVLADITKKVNDLKEKVNKVVERNQDMMEYFESDEHFSEVCFGMGLKYLKENPESQPELSKKINAGSKFAAEDIPLIVSIGEKAFYTNKSPKKNFRSLREAHELLIADMPKLEKVKEDIEKTTSKGEGFPDAAVEFPEIADKEQLIDQSL